MNHFAFLFIGVIA